MWSDSYPPAAVDPRDWLSVRDGLHEKGKSLGGARGSVGNLVYRASLALNLMQHRYKSDLFVVGGQGRLFVERALGVFIPATALAAETSMHLNIKDKIDLMEKKHYASKEVVAACHKLRLYGNRTDHDEGDDLKPEEKPDVIKNVFIVAKALLNKVTAPDNVEPELMRGAMHGCVCVCVCVCVWGFFFGSKLIIQGLW
jgi:hypothetical protein